jgi:hypothetical protein
MSPACLWAFFVSLEIVLEKLGRITQKRSRKASQPTTPDRSLNTVQSFTPIKAGEALQQRSRILFYLGQSDLASSLRKRIELYVRGTETLITAGSYAEAELSRNTAAEVARRARSSSMRHISMGEIAVENLGIELINESRMKRHTRVTW